MYKRYLARLVLTYEFALVFFHFVFVHLNVFFFFKVIFCFLMLMLKKYKFNKILKIKYLLKKILNKNLFSILQNLL